jgi:branched-chain amino acid transport system ATP-binding protein
VLEQVSETETILLVEQNLGVVQALAKHVVVLDQGRVVHTGPAAELLGDPALLSALLGVSRAAGRVALRRLRPAHDHGASGSARCTS